ncbi:carboxymuconolactone decarboxylase family protein [Streptomyces sp. TLI_146]|uniref:carboxymuconolactone decarboxylase family protein n=1 Tax=Streptomyces sp. TLI_146 TaxID=1938858 RepID=UPI000C70CD2A|nr:carboxymuconolactone decarboxylase family protein [Streptomyces sp. TLI_146]PKV87407.1 AhpD family alkylhydroperoxidase [Streptomyces sp. TLI_146]
MTARAWQVPQEVYRALAGVSAAAKKALDPTLTELVMVRASQLNHCAFCLDMHLDLARDHGETEGRLDLVAAWHEAGDRFSERERAALALTEGITVLTDGFVPDELYAQAAKHFDETQLAHLIAAITAINSWNRLMVARRTAPGETEWHS